MRRDLLRQLAAFHAVGTEGGIVAGARRLGKSPPAVHHDIAKLEERLGEKLFAKSGRGLKLTSASRQLHRDVARTLDQLERSVDRFAAAGADQRTVRVGSVSGFGRYRLAPALFSASIDARIELMTGSHDEVVVALMAGEIDVGISYRPVVSVPIDCVPLTQERLVLVAAKGTKPISPDLNIIGKLNFVTYEEYDYVFGAWFGAMFGRQPARLRRSDHATELEEAIESVAQGRGVTITPVDAWLHGPWRDRCVAPLGEADDVPNALMLLSLPGADPRIVALVRSLVEASPA